MMTQWLCECGAENGSMNLICRRCRLPPVRSEPMLAAAVGLRKALEYALRHIDCHDALMTARKALDIAEQAGITFEARCVVCGKPKDDSRHVKFGNDLDNPVKHMFTANEVLTK